MRQCQSPIASDDKIAAALERIIIEANRFALHRPSGILQDDLWAIDTHGSVATKAIGMVNRARRIRQEAGARENIRRRRQPALRIRRRDEVLLKEGNPAHQALFISERNDEDSRVERRERLQNCRLVQLRQMFIAIESAEVA